jgi:hypothetical protein
MRYQRRCAHQCSPCVIRPPDRIEKHGQNKLRSCAFSADRTSLKVGSTGNESIKT